jgi:hypothetical protein
MSVAMPTSPAPESADVRFLDWGASQVAALGGPTSRLSRLGSRHAVDYRMPPMTYADAMAWIQRLKRGMNEGAIMPFPQPGITSVVASAATATATVSGGTGLALQGLLPSATALEGQFFNVSRSGRLYLYSLNSNVTASGGGTGTISFEPMLRTAVTASVDLIIFNSVYIEGYVTGDETGWTVDVARNVGLSFTIEEAE